MTRAIFIVGMAVGKTRLREFLKQGGYAGPIYTSNTKPYSDKLDTAEGGVVTIGSRDVILEIENAHTLDEYQLRISEIPPQAIPALSEEELKEARAWIMKQHSGYLPSVTSTEIVVAGLCIRTVKLQNQIEVLENALLELKNEKENKK